MLDVLLCERLLLQFRKSEVAELTMEQEVFVSGFVFLLRLLCFPLVLVEREQPTVEHGSFFIGRRVVVPRFSVGRVNLSRFKAAGDDLLVEIRNLIVLALMEQYFFVHL